MSMINRMIEKLDQFPDGSRERIDGVEELLGHYTVILKEPALFYMKGRVMGFGPNTGESGGGYRLEVCDRDNNILFLQNSPNVTGLIHGISREIEKAGVLSELV